jgi:phage terminase large subunit-like protein
LDLASTEDITALVLYFPGAPGYVIPFFFIPEDTLRDKTRDGADFYRWRQQGYVTVTPGNRTDYDYIIQKAKDLKDQYAIKSLGYDPWNATQTAIYLQDAGFKVDEVRQGIPSMGEPTKKLHWLIISGELIHGGNPVLRWMCSNVTISRDSNDNYKMDKGKSSDKIDGMVALAIAICQWQRDNVQQPEFNIRWL